MKNRLAMTTVIILGLGSCQSNPTETKDRLVVRVDNDGETFSKGLLDQKGRRVGIWEEYELPDSNLRFKWSYKDDIKEGPYTAYRQDGSIEARGQYKKGVPNDTLFLYDYKMRCYEKQIWKISQPYKSSSLVGRITINEKGVADTQMQKNVFPKGIQQSIEDTLPVIIDSIVNRGIDLLRTDRQ
jgi:antitoxin component YwqK of YwqJK toxin-antitoxin module